MPRKMKQNNKQSKSSRRRRVRSRGARGIVSASNRSTGARIGSRIGSFLGHAAQGAIGRLFGVGEYKEALGKTIGHEMESIAENDSPSVNSLVRPLSTNHVAMMHTDEEGNCRITRREFVRPVNIRDTFETIRIDINPGLPFTFPWLHSISQSWQQWSVQGLAYEFVPTSGFAVSSTNAALGQVIMSHYYNVVNTFDIPLADPERQLNMNGSVSCSPAAPGVCYLECDPAMQNQSTFYVENPDVPVQPLTSVQNLYPAIFLLTTGGAQNIERFQAGQLWVTYDIVLKQPMPPFITPPPRLTKHERFAPYLEVFRQWSYLKCYVGPLDADRLAAREEELSRLAAILLSPPCLAAQRMIRAIHADESAHLDSEAEAISKMCEFLDNTTFLREIRRQRLKVEIPKDNAVIVEAPRTPY